ncbi:MAG: SLC13 family permease [Gemmatimonadaceae bacterium]|nr:SLC13 family permease [Gemmatimonadaceae bacterium]
MSAAVASLVALLVAIVVSMVARLNVGLLAIALAWAVGVGLGDLKTDAVLAGFPGSLFVTLVGVTALFGIAETNGSLARVATRAVRLVRGDARWLPMIFFALAMLLSTVGPGTIATVALLAPVGMAIGRQSHVNPLIMALMIGNGENAGNLSPVSTVGVIANAKMAEAGIVGHESVVWFANAAAHLIVTIAAYLLFRGWRPATTHATDGVRPIESTTSTTPSLTGPQRLTLGVIGAWLVGVVALSLPVGPSALTAALVLLIARAADETQVVRALPWGVLLMVCGVSVLIAVLEKTGGMQLFSALLASIASASTINGAIAFVTGAISSWSSTSGVVLPAFLPTVTRLAQDVGGGDPLAIALSINVGSALVDVSPLSTVGALCVATVTDPIDARRLFRQLLFWGLSMCVVGALLCQLFAGPLARL